MNENPGYKTFRSMGRFTSGGAEKRVTIVGIGDLGGTMIKELLMNRQDDLPRCFSYALPPDLPLEKTRQGLMENYSRTDGSDKRTGSIFGGIKDEDIMRFKEERRTVLSNNEPKPVSNGFSSNRDWLDRRLLVMNPAYAKLRSLGNNMVDWARDIVYNSDTIFIISDLMDESLDICLLLDAFSNRAGRRLIIFLIQSKRYKDIWNVQFLNKRIQEVALRAACVIIVPPINSGNLGVMPDILVALYNLIDHTGTVNIDLADIRNIAGYGNIGMMGVGTATGTNRAEKAIKKAISHPMLEIDLEGIERVIVCVNGGEDMTIEEAENVSYFISKRIREGAKIIWGAHVSEELRDHLEVVLLVGLTPHQALLHHYAET